MKVLTWQGCLILAMILLSSGDQLLCFAEMRHLQRLLTAINAKLLLLPIYQLWRYVTNAALKVALLFSCLRHYLSKKDTHTHTHFRHALCFIIYQTSTYWSSQQSSICVFTRAHTQIYIYASKAVWYTLVTFFFSLKIYPFLIWFFKVLKYPFYAKILSALL